MRLGVTELILIVVLILGLGSPETLKSVSKQLGLFLRGLSKTSEERHKDIVDPVQDALKPVTDLKNTIKESLSNDKEC